jgi:hypothetical protein
MLLVVLVLGGCSNQEEGSSGAVFVVIELNKDVGGM